MWDREDGDAQKLGGIEDNSQDFLHSSHCLEHLKDPKEGLLNWFRVVKPGGHLIITVPDEDLYEQGQIPSTYNGDHKWTFTILKTKSWSPCSINLIDLAAGLGATAEILKLQKLDDSFRYSLPRFDQTMTPVGESGIELILRKRPDEESLTGAGNPCRAWLVK